MGMKETKEMVDFIIELAHAMDKSMADGKIGIEDLGHFISAMTLAGPAFADMGKIPSEMQTMTEQQSQDLIAHVKRRLTLSNAKVEQISELAVEIGLKVYQLMCLMKAEAPAPMPVVE
jgi:hypothetical protein